MLIRVKNHGLTLLRTRVEPGYKVGKPVKMVAQHGRLWRDNKVTALLPIWLEPLFSRCCTYNNGNSLLHCRKAFNGSPPEVTTKVGFCPEIFHTIAMIKVVFVGKGLNALGASHPCG